MDKFSESESFFNMFIYVTKWLPYITKIMQELICTVLSVEYLWNYCNIKTF